MQTRGRAGRRLVPTQLGTVLVQGYYRIDADLVLPLVRSSIEKQCDLIAKGQAHKQDVLALSLASFHQKFNYFVKNIHRMDTLFEASFSPLTAGAASSIATGIAKISLFMSGLLFSMLCGRDIKQQAV